MRIRNRPWAKKELKECGFYIDEPEHYKSRWKEKFQSENTIHLELGCGKGEFISNIALKNQNINYIAVDLIDTMLGLAKRKIEEKYKEENKQVNNIILVRFDIERIPEMIDKKDNISRIYINFCNPWPKAKHHKKRLTHIKQLDKYSKFLSENGEIFFKTDDNYLFEDSKKYFVSTGYEIEKETYNLEKEKNFWNGEENIETEHEKMFSSEGLNIKALIAKKYN